MGTVKVKRDGGNFIVVLPHEWVENVKLKDGDLVDFAIAPDNSLRLTYRMLREPYYSIDVDLFDEPRLLTRLIIGCYVIGLDKIVITTKSRFESRHVDEVRFCINRLIGISIVEESQNQIILQTFIDSSKQSIYELLRRLCSNVYSMLELLISAFIEGGGLIDEVLRLEDEVDKTYRLIIRLLIQASRNSGLMTAIGIKSRIHLLGNRAVAKSLELAADTLEETAYIVKALHLEGGSIDETIINNFYQYSRLIKLMTKKSIDSFISLNLKLANEALENKTLIERLKTSLIEETLLRGKDVKTTVNLTTLISNLSSISDHLSTLAEVTINRILENVVG